ncbi:hypothetical protein O0L34_g7678 [Tuta absoluta]|nr:hypothetical protein O0L34_g7678 [Tuta absoluta]
MLWSAEGKVLDPALYLNPSPPLSPVNGEVEILWSQPRAQRDADLAVIPIRQIITPTQTTETLVPTIFTTTTQQPMTTPQLMTVPPTTAPEQEEIMDKAETFWPRIRPTASGPYLGIQGIHVPLTFSLTGTYGRYGTGAAYDAGNRNIGVVGSSYASVDTGDLGLFKLYGKSALAGSSYGNYGGYGGTRLYGSGGGAAWTGWGNGKWGHYGKG